MCMPRNAATANYFSFAPFWNSCLNEVSIFKYYPIIFHRKLRQNLLELHTKLEPIESVKQKGFLFYFHTIDEKATQVFVWFRWWKSFYNTRNTVMFLQVSRDLKSV